MTFTTSLGSRFRSCSSIARKQAEIQHAIHDQYEASIRDWHNIVEFTSRSNDSLLAAVQMPGISLRETSVLYVLTCSVTPPHHRLMAEHQSEVRNTLQAILAHLSEETTVKTPTESNPATSPTATCNTAVDVNEEGPIPLQKGNGKSKENADSDTPKEFSALPAHVASSLFQISSITARLEILLATFQFPAELDFSPALGTADVFALTYTPANSPVLTQAHALSLLFADLDNVLSFGSDVLRNARRAAVIRVDQALQKLDEGVEERRGRARAKKADPVTVPVDQPAHPNDGEPLEHANVASAGC
ncbi:hypothetical protein EDD22DRAFT_1009815 [Suillus occidentalis]|nr:hypothetical protein EDD22DRAFT_1009815 [Suillus occidentalis]